MFAIEDTSEPEAPNHFLHFHQGDDRALVANAAQYIGEGLARGNAVIIVATARHRELFLSELERAGARPKQAEKDGQLICADAHDMLARFMVDGHPDGGRFDSTVGQAVRSALTRAAGRGLRAYGEMVGVLWQQQQYPAAIRLEQLWNKLQRSVHFDLFCAYPIDVFDKHFQSGVVDALLCSHTRVLPSTSADLEGALNRAMDEVLGPKVETLKPPVEGAKRRAWASMPKGEASILWLRNNLPDKANEIIARARQYYYSAGAASGV